MFKVFPGGPRLGFSEGEAKPPMQMHKIKASSCMIASIALKDIIHFLYSPRRSSPHGSTKHGQHKYIHILPPDDPDGVVLTSPFILM
mmetsp:Transcript_3873/g.4292  ORF Transcript_3873/g.4292 Transcript_3873/m.4292 type:complete len:87 (+) Transcript_3873:219-479(+)